MNVRYRVELSQAERDKLKALRWQDAQLLAAGARGATWPQGGAGDGGASGRARWGGPGAGAPAGAVDHRQGRAVRAVRGLGRSWRAGRGAAGAGAAGTGAAVRRCLARLAAVVRAQARWVLRRADDGGPRAGGVVDDGGDP